MLCVEQCSKRINKTLHWICHKIGILPHDMSTINVKMMLVQNGAVNK